MNALLTWILLFRIIAPTVSCEVYPGVPYKTVGARVLRADVYVPTVRPGPVPAAVFVHGGAWEFGRRTDNADLARLLAAEGLAAVLIDFRDLTAVGLDAQIADIRDAVRWVRAEAGAYGIDPDRIGIVGSSSGAHLASLVAYAGSGEGLGDDPADASSRVNACMFLYGAYDLARMATYAGAPDPVASWYFGTDLQTVPRSFARYSAATYVDGSEPPTLLVHGTKDVVVPIEQSQELKACLERAGVPVELVSAPGFSHGFVLKQPWVRPWIAGIAAEFFLRTLND